MAFQFSAPVRNGALDSIETNIGASAILKIRTGAAPATCGTADSGTVLATMNLPSDWLAAASSGSKAKSGTWQDAAADAAGLSGHFRIYASDGTTCHVQGATSEPWAQSKAYLLNQYVHANGNVYRATAAGTSAGTGTGPSHTTGTASDGTVTWAFVQVGTDMELDNTSIAAGQQVTVSSFTLNAGGA